MMKKYLIIISILLLLVVAGCTDTAYITTLRNTTVIYGDINQTHGSSYINNVYGEMYIDEENMSSLSFVSTDVYENITINQTQGLLNNVSYSGGTLVIGTSGIYNVIWSASFSSQTGSLHGFTVGVNGVKQHNCYVRRKVGSLDVGNIADGCFINVSSGDVVTLMASDEDASLNNILVESANFRIVRIGN